MMNRALPFSEAISEMVRKIKGVTNFQDFKRMTALLKRLSESPVMPTAERTGGHPPPIRYNAAPYK
jgi:hypothetical protein